MKTIRIKAITPAIGFGSAWQKWRREQTMTISKKIRILFVGRVILWIIALVSTGYWMWYSGELYELEISNTEEYAARLRPVLYTGIIVAVAAIGISFLLYAQSQKLKKSMEKEETNMTDNNKDGMAPVSRRQDGRKK